MPRFPWGLKKEDFFFSRRDQKIFRAVLLAGGITGGFFFVVLFIIALFSGSIRQFAAADRLAREQAGPTAAVEPARRPESALPAAGRHRLSLNDFMLIDGAQTLVAPGCTPYRERIGRWDRNRIEAYWIPPRRLGLEKLRVLNDKNIERLFEDIR